jgi:hypothetical protein
MTFDIVAAQRVFPVDTNRKQARFTAFLANREVVIA